MSNALMLVPIPRQMTLSSGDFPLAANRLILVDGGSQVHTLQGMIFSARRFQQTLKRWSDLDWELTASQAVPGELVGLTLRIDPVAQPQPQGYDLVITPQGMTLTAHDEAGLFYGICTLNQIATFQAAVESPFALPALTISDWPDYPARGVMLDISRDKVPTMETLFDLVDLLAGWKINQLQLYTEHTFAYHQHPEVWAEASPITGQDVLALDAFCRERYIELVPNQNSFGHMHRWLSHSRYLSLSETPEGYDYPWGGRSSEPFTLCPLDPGSLALVEGLYDELLPHFTSRQVNVGCDETWDLGQGRSHEACRQRGVGRVYMEFLLKIYQAVKARGHTMQFWGDIILQHPDLIPDLPQDMIALAWGYDAEHPFADHAARFAAAGLPFYVCPGTSSWNSIAGRTQNALENLRNAAENGHKHGALGFLNTDWGDQGHWQTLPVSYLGFMVGAAYSWALESNQALDIPRLLGLRAFGEAASRPDQTAPARLEAPLAQVAYDLGNVYRAVGMEPANSSVLFWLLQNSLAELRQTRGNMPPKALRQALEAIDAAVAPLSRQKVDGASCPVKAHPYAAVLIRPDADLLRREIDLAVRMLRHAARRGLFALNHSSHTLAELRADLGGIIEDYRAIWLARNRPGGLVDSVGRLEKALEDYKS